MKTVIISKNENQPINVHRYDTIEQAAHKHLNLDKEERYIEVDYDIEIHSEIINVGSLKEYPRNLINVVNVIEVDGPTRIYFFDDHLYRIYPVTK